MEPEPTAATLPVGTLRRLARWFAGASASSALLPKAAGSTSAVDPASTEVAPATPPAPPDRPREAWALLRGLH